MTTNPTLRNLAVAMANNAREATQIQRDFEAAAREAGVADKAQLATATGTSPHYLTVMTGYAAQAAYLTVQFGSEEAR